MRTETGVVLQKKDQACWHGYCRAGALEQVELDCVLLFNSTASDIKLTFYTLLLTLAGQSHNGKGGIHHGRHAWNCGTQHVLVLK